MATARRRATYDDLLKVPEHMVAEIIDGELYTTPRPSSPHAYAASAISSDIFGRFSRPPGGADAPGGWWIVFEPELHFGSDVVVPDIAGWRRTHMPVLPSVAFFEQSPDWICEVVSPSTGRLDRGHKMRIYSREKVAYLWIVDPIIRTLEVYRLESARWIVASTYGGNDLVHAEPFDAVELDLSRWWLD